LSNKKREVIINLLSDLVS